MTDIIRQLRYIQEKYKNDIVSTGRVVISDLARDCANEIERLQKEILKYKEKAAKYKAERDKAVEDMRRCRRNKCDYCYYSNKNQNTPCRDCQSPISNCGDRWKWRGLEASK